MVVDFSVQNQHGAGLACPLDPLNFRIITGNTNPRFSGLGYIKNPVGLQIKIGRSGISLV
jgi:hypothetical protein